MKFDSMPIRTRLAWAVASPFVIALMACTLSHAQAPQPLPSTTPRAAGSVATTSGAPMSDRSVVGVRLSDRGSLCATRSKDSLMRHAQEGYATMPELGASSRLGSRFADVIAGSPDQVLEQAREKGCALIVTDSDQAGLIVAALIGARTAHRVLPPRPEPEAVSALLGYLGLERYEQLVLLEALPLGGGKNDLPPLIEAGVVNPKQLAALTARIAQSGYASSVDIGSLRQFLADQKEGAGENKTARQIQQAREAARVAAEKERVEAEEKKQRDAQRAGTWEKVKTWVTGIGVVLTVILVVWIMMGSSTECPSCKKWFGKETLQRQEMGRSTRYETETKVEEYKNKKGEVIMTKERQEQVLYNYVRYQHLNQCKFCSYQWMTESTSKYKG